MAELPDDTYGEITRLCKAGDDAVEWRDYQTAVRNYRDAWTLLPEPQHEWAAAT